MLYTCQSTSSRSNKSSKQNFVVELKTLFFFFLIVILFFYHVLFIHFPTGERQGMGWFYLQAWLKIAKNFSSFSNHSIHVIFMYSSNSLCFPFVSDISPAQLKTQGKSVFFFPVGPSLTTPLSKGPRVCEGPELERIIGCQQGSHGAAATCHLHH